MIKNWLTIVNVITLLISVFIFFNLLFQKNYIDNEYWLLLIIFMIVSLSGYFINKKTKRPMSDEVAKAMASKIIFEATQHRKNRDSYNFVKMTSEEEE